MNSYIKLYTLLIVMIGLGGCKKDTGVLTPSTGNDGYKLNQGTNDYDATILSYYQKYGTYFLYKFTDKDAYWTPTGYSNAVLTTGGLWSNGFEMTSANQQYISAQLSLIDKACFKFYSDKFLKELLPVKMLLCSSVDSVYTDFDFSTNPVTYKKGLKAVGAWYNYDNICVNYGNANVLSMSKQDSITFLGKINLILINSIIGRNKTAPPAAFISATSYLRSPTSSSDAYAKGILTPYYNGPTPTSDWYLYIQAMVTSSETMLKSAPPSIDDTSFLGILNSAKDTNGIILTRYNLVRNYFIANYNVDLQLIGNASHPL